MSKTHNNVNHIKVKTENIRKKLISNINKNYNSVNYIKITPVKI